jgi:hypothetical protein
MAQTYDFLQGWRCLPDELKLMVLEFALPSGETLKSNHFNKGGRWVFRDRINCDHDILPLLACPELTDLATGVLYQNNTMRISFEDLYLPPPAVRRHIRKIELSFDVNTSDFSRLATLIKGNVDFPGLELVKVNADYIPGKNKELELSILKGLDTIRFPALQLRVSLLYETTFYPFDIMEPSRQEVAAIVLPKLTVEVNEGREARECYESPHSHDDENHTEMELAYFLSMGWPATDGCCRTSKKTVWI